MSTIRVERATEKDIKQITSLITREFSYFSRDPERLKKGLQKEQIVLFKALAGKTLAGFIEVQKLSPFEARINGITIKEQFRKRGMGKKLVNTALDFLEQENISRVKLLVKKSNTIAKSLYAKAGFSFVQVHPRKIQGEPVEELHLFLDQTPREAS